MTEGITIILNKNTATVVFFMCEQTNYTEANELSEKVLFVYTGCKKNSQTLDRKLFQKLKFDTKFWLEYTNFIFRILNYIISLVVCYHE